MNVWILLSTSVLLGDPAEAGADRVATRARAYATREAACDALREFMRTDVNEANDDWRDDYGVDDALDAIFEYDEDLESDGDGLWTYDGTLRSCEWRLMRLEVRS